MKSDLLTLDGTVLRDPAIDAWFDSHRNSPQTELSAAAREWFEAMRHCGDEVREVFHDGCPNACLGNVPFGYVNVFASHANVGFFRGNALPDPKRLLSGSGKNMRHVRLGTGQQIDATSLRHLIQAACHDIKAQIENG